MSSTTPTSSSGINTAPLDAEEEIDADELADRGDLQTQPAEAVASHFNTWGEFVEFDDDWEDINGVGPASARNLSAACSEVKASVEMGLPAESADDAQTTSDDDEETEESDDEATHEDGGENEVHPRVERGAPPETFSVSIQKEALSEIADSMNALVDEAKFFIHEDRMEFCAVDAANVGMFDIDLSQEAFNSWVASPGVIGVDLVRLTDILSMGDKDETVILELVGQKLTIEIDGLVYTLGLIDTALIRQSPKIPELEIPGKATLDADHFEQAVKAGEMVSDHMTISVDDIEGVIQFSADGDTDDVELTLNEDDIESLSPANVSSIFSLEYLKSLKSIISNADEVVLEIGDGMPLFVHLTLAEGNAEVLLLLAPRIES